MKQHFLNAFILIVGCAATVAYVQGVPSTVPVLTMVASSTTPPGWQSEDQFAAAVPYALTDSNVLMTDAGIDKAKLHACQPLAGENVLVMQRLNNAEGMQGLNLAQVYVVEGSCKGKTGWVGTARLKKVN